LLFEGSGIDSDKSNVTLLYYPTNTLNYMNYRVVKDMLKL